MILSVYEKLDRINEKYDDQLEKPRCNIEAKKDKALKAILLSVLTELSERYPTRKITYISGMGVACIDIEMKNGFCLAAFNKHIPMTTEGNVETYGLLHLKERNWIAHNSDHPLAKASIFLEKGVELSGNFPACLGGFTFLGGKMISEEA